MKPVKCKYCGKILKGRRGLSSHYRKHYERELQKERLKRSPSLKGMCKK